MEAQFLCSEDDYFELKEYFKEIEKDDDNEEQMICSVCQKECNLLDENPEYKSKYQTFKCMHIMCYQCIYG